MLGLRFRGGDLAAALAAVAVGFFVVVVLNYWAKLLLGPVAFIVVPSLVVATAVWLGPLRVLQGLLVLMWYPIFIPVPSQLAPLLGLATGQELAMYMLAAAALVRIRRVGLTAESRRFLRAAGIVLGALALLGIVGVGNSPVPDYGIAYFRWTCLVPMAVLLNVFVWCPTREALVQLVRAFLLGCAVFAGVMFVAWLAGLFGGSINTIEGARLGGTLHLGSVLGFHWDPVNIGTSLAVCLPLCVSLLIAPVSRNLRLLAACASVATSATILFAGARGGWFAALAGLLCVLILAGRRRPRILLPTIAALALLAGVMAAAWNSVGTEALSQRVESLSSMSTDPNVISRQSIWRLYWHDVIARGADPGGFYYVFLSGRGNPHNMYIFVAMGTGLLGLVLFVGGLTSLAVRLWLRAGPRQPEMKATVWGAGGALVSLLVGGISDAQFMEAFTAMVVVAVLAIGVRATFLTEPGLARGKGRADRRHPASRVQSRLLGDSGL